MIFFVIPVVITFLLLVLHSYIVRGPIKTFVFFFWSMFFVWLKELNPPNMDVPGNPDDVVMYTFGDPGFHFQIFGFTVPIIGILGWTFAFYMSWHLAMALTNRYDSLRGRIFPILSLGLLIMCSISLAMETTGSNAGWWTWAAPVLEAHVSLFSFPLWVIGAWGVVYLLVMANYLIIVEANTGRAWLRLLIAPASIAAAYYSFHYFHFIGLIVPALILIYLVKFHVLAEADIGLVETFIFTFTQVPGEYKMFITLPLFFFLFFVKKPKLDPIYFGEINDDLMKD